MGEWYGSGLGAISGALHCTICTGGWGEDQGVSRDVDAERSGNGGGVDDAISVDTDDDEVSEGDGGTVHAEGGKSPCASPE